MQCQVFHVSLVMLPFLVLFLLNLFLKHINLIIYPEHNYTIEDSMSECSLNINLFFICSLELAQFDTNKKKLSILYKIIL